MGSAYANFDLFSFILGAYNCVWKKEHVNESRWAASVLNRTTYWFQFGMYGIFLRQKFQVCREKGISFVQQFH